MNKLGLLKNAALPARIEHVQLIDPQDVPGLAQHNIVASMQPIHAPSDRHMADIHWGSRCANAYAWNSVASSGARLVFGSDAPVESPNPYWGTYAAVTRKPLDPREKLEGWYPQQCLSVEQALAAYITQPHIVSGNSAELGVIRAGAIADLAIFTSDPFTLSEAEWLDLLPSATMVDGEWAYQRS